MGAIATDLADTADPADPADPPDPADSGGPTATGADLQTQRAGAMRRIIAFSILNHSAFAGSRVAVALAGLQLHASPFAIGLILSFYSLLPMFLAVPAGRWIDRTGMRLPMLIGTSALAFGVIVPFLAWDIGGLYLASVTIGVGFMAFHLCVQKVAGDLGGDAKRKEYFSQLALGYSVSGFLGPTLAGFAIDLLGHRVVFGLLAIAPALAWIALKRYRFEHLRVEPEHALPERAAGARVLDLLDVPDLRRMYLAIVLISACWDVHQFLVPLYGALHGLSASSIGLVLGSFAVATFVVRLAMPLFLHRYSEWRLILIAMWICAIVYAAYPWFPTLPVMLTLSFVLGLGLGVCQPMILTVLHKSAPPGRVGEATGLRMTLVSATQTVLPTVFGAMGGVLGLAPMFLGMTTLVAVGAVLARRGLPAGSLVGGAAMVSDPNAESEDKL